MPRENIQQQTRAQVLVAKVHIAGLAMLVGFNGAYALSVSIITVTALYLVSRDPSRARHAKAAMRGANEAAVGVEAKH